MQRRLDRESSSEKRGSSEEATQICKNWSTGDGYCKWGEKCRFLHTGPQGGSKRIKGAGGKGSSKRKGRGKGKGKGKGKARRLGSRNKQGPTLIVQKKGDRDDENKSSSAMMVGEHEGHKAEEELYNLMRGYTTLMVTDDRESDESDVSEEESVNEDKGEEEVKSQSSANVPDPHVPDPRYAHSVNHLLWSKNGPPQDSLEGSSCEERGRSKPVGEDPGGSSSAEPEWGHENGPLMPDPNFANSVAPI
jgi:hypothetical protein